MSTTTKQVTIKSLYSKIISSEKTANNYVTSFCSALNSFDHDQLVLELNELMQSFKKIEDKKSFSKRLQNYKTRDQFTPATHPDKLVLRKDSKQVYSYGQPTGLNTTDKTGKGTQKTSDTNLLQAKLDSTVIAAKAEKTKNANGIQALKNDHKTAIMVNSLKKKTTREIFDRLQAELSKKQFNDLAIMLSNTLKVVDKKAA